MASDPAGGAGCIQHRAQHTVPKDVSDPGRGAGCILDERIEREIELFPTREGRGLYHRRMDERKPPQSFRPREGRGVHCFDNPFRDKRNIVSDPARGAGCIVFYGVWMRRGLFPTPGGAWVASPSKYHWLNYNEFPTPGGAQVASESRLYFQFYRERVSDPGRGAGCIATNRLETLIKASFRPREGRGLHPSRIKPSMKR